MSSRNAQLSHGKKTLGFQKVFIILIGVVAFFIIVVGSYYQALPWNVYSHGTSALDNLALSLGIQKHTHAVVIDAGSTGSRVLAFTFHQSYDGNLKLDRELFVEVKPGLSSFSENPKKGAEKLEELLEKAKEEIPQDSWASTPLTIKATAGLRLLPPDKAEAILHEVRELCMSSPFHCFNSSVSIMDGVDEGLFSWFTVNFLLDRLGGHADHTVAALDLGGGSTQITFALSEKEELLKKVPLKFVHQVSAFHTNLSVYTNSLLGLGLMAARQGILQQGNPKSSKILKSPCINPIISSEWSYGGETYVIGGPEVPSYEHIKGGKGEVSEERPIVKFDDCLKVIKDIVHHRVDKPIGLEGREINAFSYYYDRAVEVGLIDPFKGGVITVEHFTKAAKSACAYPNADQPFMCLDLTFISVLLQDGFLLKPKTKLHLFKKIDNHEISWALGAAFHLIQNGF
ncbi:ectonucleoside triphosphate diphosphohydrolase 5-like isoform X2 [Ischnura elegans]|nr:ectonucleoside triphosphate diphosphohydrolase 5-like isoform X2 [Ischnura elegans]XP_046382643.1 ectonucleoside triphosphate diphosphohydrolase 5-like isoform X2 [Ischnura elegans]